jgi:excisionase family DNA binding protein
LEPFAPRSASAIDLGARLVTVSEAATLMRVSKMTVYRLIHTHALSATRIGRSFRIHRRDLIKFMHTDQH